MTSDATTHWFRDAGKFASRSGYDGIAVAFALTGREITAQGKLLRRPGYTPPISTPP